MFLSGALLVFLALGTTLLYLFPAPGNADTPFVRALELMLDPGSFNDSDKAPFSLVAVAAIIVIVIFAKKKK